MRAVLLVLILLVAAMAYIRLAPSDPARWHRFTSPKAPGLYPGAGSFEVRRVVVSDPKTVFDLVLHQIEATPRTRLLTGGPEEGFVTYMTRSALWGFPDYTTAYLTRNDAQAGGLTTLTIHGRLRFGHADLGVNRARIEAWLAALPVGALQSLPE